MISTKHPDHKEEEGEVAEGRIEALRMVVRDIANTTNMRNKTGMTNGTYPQARTKEDGKSTKAKSQLALLIASRRINVAQERIKMKNRRA